MDWQTEIAMIPHHMREPMLNYIRDGIPTGSFLNAVLANDLRGAVGRADPINLSRITDFAQYLTWHAPSSCWGSQERVDAWIERGGLNGINKEMANASQNQA